MIPAIAITKSDGNTGVVRPSATGVDVLIGPSSTGTQDTPTLTYKTNTAVSTFGYGPLTEFAAYQLSVGGKPRILIKSAASTAATNGTVTHSGAGTSVVTATGTPYDDFDVVFKFTTGGTIGVAGIVYQVSLDGGVTYGGSTSLGVAVTASVANTGVAIALAAGTILANQTESFSTVGPRATNADLVTALEALRLSNLSYEGIQIVTPADATMLATLDAWLTAREAEGKFRDFGLNTRARTIGTETEAQFKTAMDTAFGASSSIRGIVCGDFAATVSPIRGINMKRPTLCSVGARKSAVDMSRDLAAVADGPLSGVTLADAQGNPKWHDETIYPGLDDSRFTTLRSIDQKQGAYITNPLVFSASGSDYVYLQHVRCMNRACELAFQLLTEALSDGVLKQTNSDGSVTIKEEIAQRIESGINSRLRSELVTPQRVTDAQIVISRTDDLSSNAGATITGELQLSPLAYLKKFNINAKFVKTITAAAT